jgi:hypothetical protein
MDKSIELKTIKGTLLQEAYDLNSKDSALHAEGVHLDKEREVLIHGIQDL